LEKIINELGIIGLPGSLGAGKVGGGALSAETTALHQAATETILQRL
jgi:hypothetical protein